MKKRSLEYFTQIASNFINVEYDLQLNIPLVINNRLSRTLGRYKETTDGQPIQIDISNKLFTYAHEHVANGVVKHEVVHYALSLLGRPNNDGDAYFEKELIKHKLPSSIDKNRAIQFVGEKYILACIMCGNEFSTSVKRVVHGPHLYVSNCCQARINHIGTQTYDGTKNGICLFL